MTTTIMIDDFVNYEAKYDAYDKREQNFVSLENTFNILGYIPGVSHGSGAVRFVIGVAQVIVTIVKTPFLLIAELFSNHPMGFGYRLHRNSVYIVHGGANIVRGLIEAVLPIIGNLAAISYDVLGLRVAYSVEYR